MKEQGLTSTDLFTRNRIDIDIGQDLQTYSFVSGLDLIPFERSLTSKFQKLWASALTRNIDDPLVIEDSAKFPYALTERIIIAKGTDGEIPIFFSYRDTVSPNGDAGMYLHICLVEQEYQGRGLTRKLINHVLTTSSRKFIVLTTQNEHMIQTLRPFCTKGNLYPIDASPTDEIKAIADVVLKNKSNFDTENFVRRSIYSGGVPLYGDRIEKHSSNPDIRNFFEKNVNFQNGDAVLIVGLLF